MPQKQKKKKSSILKSPLATKISLLLFALIRFTLRLLPFSFSKKLFSSLAGFASSFAKKDLEISKAQLKLAFPTKDSSWIEETALNSFKHLGIFVAETIHYDKFLLNSNSIIIEGKEFFSRMCRGDGPGMVLSAHLGPFELLAAYCSMKGTPLTVVGRDPNYPAMDTIVNELREGYGVETIWRKSSNSGVELRLSLIHISEPTRPY